MQAKSRIMYSFRHPTTILIAGPNQDEKNFFDKQFPENQVIQTSPSRFIYVYGELATDIADLKQLYPTIEKLQGMKNVPDFWTRIDED